MPMPGVGRIGLGSRDGLCDVNDLRIELEKILAGYGLAKEGSGFPLGEVALYDQYYGLKSSSGSTYDDRVKFIYPRISGAVISIPGNFFREAVKGKAIIDFCLSARVFADFVRDVKEKLTLFI